MKLSEWLPVTRRLGLSLRVMAWLLVLNLVSIFFEGLGVAMLLPIFELLRHGDWSTSTELSGRHWEIIREVSDYFGIQISLGLLLSVSFGFVLLRQLSKFCYIRSQQVAIRQSTETIRRRIFNGFLRSQTAIQDNARVGEIVADLTVELQRALSSIYSVVRAAGTVVQIAVYVGGLFMLAPAMTFVAISIIAVAGLCLQRLMRKVKEIGAEITDANAQLSAFIVERLRHLRLIRLSNTESAEATAFSKLSHRHSQEYLRQKLVTTVLSLLTDPIIIALGYAVLLIGGQVFGMSLESLGLMVIVLIRLIPVTQGLISDHNSIMGQWPSVQKVDDCLRSLLESREPKGGDVIFDKLDHEIGYERVSFSYGGSAVPALKDVSVALPAHRMTALIGPSGAGKSTFVDLLPRLRDPTGGVIRFDGVPITDFSTASLRAGIAFVPQQPQIFDITAAEHIRYGKEDASDEEVREAAQLAGALEFIERLPEGFDTLLGDGGKRLSGGQRQRLDIARALVRRAPILVLDEPTSALDAEAEAMFREAIRVLRERTKLTIIVIAHRLSTISDADQIVVLRQGHVEAVGSHDDLIAKHDWYARVYQDQQRQRSESVLPNFGIGSQ